MPDLRSVPSITNPQIIDTQRPFSNFAFIEKLKINSFPIHRLFSQARISNYKTLTIEEIPNVGFSSDDDKQLEELGIKMPQDNLLRLGFFSTTFNKLEAIKDQKESDFIGYAILKKIPINDQYYKWIVFESVIEPNEHEHNFFHKLVDYNINICGNILKIKGILYCQQNELNNVCAHVGLRTVVSMLNPSGDISYTRMNDMLKDSGKPHIIREGLGIEQICAILDCMNIKYSINSANKNDNVTKRKVEIPYQKYIYGSIESGYPALLGFSLKGRPDANHIIPILGHTLNQDTWVPNAETSYFVVGKDTRYVPSESWVSSYICHDDNFGSYYCIPRQYISTSEDALVIATKPEQAFYDGIEAEALAIDHLYSLLPKIYEKNKDNIWTRRLSSAITESNGWVVLRTIYMTAKEYIEHISLLNGWDNKTIPRELISALGEVLKGNFWVVEISLPELFPANKRKLGEIILNASTKDKTLKDTFVFARILDKLYFIDRKISGIELLSYDAGIDTHTQLHSI